MSDVPNARGGASLVLRPETPHGRVYEHVRCGGLTEVTEGDFTHICNPFRPCIETFCCQCSRHVPLNEVNWADTQEVVSAYRKRLRRATPMLIKLWRYGLGVLGGGFLEWE